tara:strand:+ start:484 stop:705 length:222 start_codon:yes stop_codon:yes gene_type:complete
MYHLGLRNEQPQTIIKVIQFVTPMNIIKVTDQQLQYLRDIVLEAYSLDIPAMKDWDEDSFEGLVDAICGAEVE